MGKRPLSLFALPGIALCTQIHSKLGNKLVQKFIIAFGIEIFYIGQYGNWCWYNPSIMHTQMPEKWSDLSVAIILYIWRIFTFEC